MRAKIERAHIFHRGMGNRKNKPNLGRGCECPENILMLKPYYHDVLDMRIPNQEIEHFKVKYMKKLERFPRNYRHKIAFGHVFGYTKDISMAIRHWEKRNRGKTKCAKK